MTVTDAGSGPPGRGRHGSAPADALAELLRGERRRVLATLIRLTGDLTLAEDAVQDAGLIALETWRRQGVPPNPRAWLTLTAKRRVIDLLRREVARPVKEREAITLAVQRAPDDTPVGVVRDDQLRLLFTCCHPALAREAQVALSLRVICGLSVAEVAGALLVPEATRPPTGTRSSPGTTCLSPSTRARSWCSIGRRPSPSAVTRPQRSPRSTRSRASATISGSMPPGPNCWRGWDAARRRARRRGQPVSSRGRRPSFGFFSFGIRPRREAKPGVEPVQVVELVDQPDRSAERCRPQLRLSRPVAPDSQVSSTSPGAAKAASLPFSICSQAT